MRQILSFLKMLGLSLFLVYINFIATLLLPTPFNRINLFFLSIILLILGLESGIVIWLSLMLFFIVDLYSPSLFGLIFFSGVMSVLITYWFYLYVFTNKSWRSAVVLSVVSIATFRIFYMALYLVIEYSRLKFHFDWTHILTYFAWEICLTSIVTGVIVFILSKKWKRFKAEKVTF